MNSNLSGKQKSSMTAKAKEKEMSSVLNDEDDKEEMKGLSSISKAIQKEKTKQFFIWSWGKNKYGELSHGGTINATIPRGVRGLKDRRIKWLSSGAQHSAAVTEEGDLFVCGSYLHGKLGIEGLTKVNVPVFQQVLALKGLKVKQVECGDYHTLCLLENGVVYTWGGTLYKKLGQRGGGKDYRSPAPVLGLSDKKIQKVGCGDFHSVALTNDGKLYSWGGGGNFFNRGQCGHGNNKDLENPELIRGLEHKVIVKLACGGYHTLALSSDNELYAWGAGLYGECGSGSFAHSNAPKLVIFQPKGTLLDPSESIEGQLKMTASVPGAELPQIKEISAGGHHSMVLSEEGQLYTFGYSAHGQLGLHNTVNQCTPQLVKDFKGKQIVQIAAGWNHSVVLTTRGDLYACGHGGSGQLGLGETEIMPNFTFIAATGPKDIKKIYAGGNHTWVTLDPEHPEREDYSPPSPLQVAVSSKSPGKSKAEGLTIEDLALLNVHKEALTQSNYYLQVSFTDLGYCHRFVRYAVPERNEEKIAGKIAEFMEELKARESGVLYHRIQVDEDVINEESKIVESPAKTKFGKYYTLCIVVDPAKNTPPILPKADREDLSKEATNEGLLGVITNVREELIKAEAGLDGKLSAWVKHFHKDIVPYCGEQPIFFELRPLIYKDQ